MPAYTTDSGDQGSRYQAVAAVGFVALAVVATYMPAPLQQQVASSLRSTVLRPFVIVQETVAETRSRASETGELRRQLDSLTAILVTHRSVAEENRRLRGLLQVSGQLGSSYTSATVIRPGTEGSESMFLVDVGGERGVRKGSPVITRHGLVGMIRDVRGNSAIGMDWTHPDFRASAMDVDGVTYGIVESRRGDFREDDRLVFNGTAFHTRLEDGTIVVTSGLGGVYPRGVPIGTVEGLAESDAGWRKSYWLRPMVDPGAVTHVLVGAESAQAGDLSGVWPADSVLTGEELAARVRAREDSLGALADSVSLLRVILAATEPVRDSVLARILLGGTVEEGRGARRAPGAGGGPGSAAPPPRPDTTLPRPDTTRPDTTRPDTIGVTG